MQSRLLGHVVFLSLDTFATTLFRNNQMVRRRNPFREYISMAFIVRLLLRSIAQVHAATIIQSGTTDKEYSYTSTRDSLDHDREIGKYCTIASSVQCGCGYKAGM